MRNDQPVALTFALYTGENLIRRQTVAKEIVRVGSGATANVRIEDASVARMHAVVEAQRTDDVTLIDLGNQTRVNGMVVNKCALEAGDEITMGDVRLVLETIEHAAAKRVATAKPFDALKANPFLVKAPFNAFDQTVTDDAPEGSYEYRVVGDGPGVDVDTDADAVEVKIYWGNSLLHIAHLDADAAFYAGETASKALRCDYFIPSEKLGTTRAPLVIAGSAVLLPDAAATVSVDGEPALSAAEAIAKGLATPCAEIAGAHQVVIKNGMTVKLELDDIRVELSGTKKARKVATAFTMAAIAGGALAYILGSFFGHAGLLAALAAFMPPLGATAEEEMTDDQRYLVQQYLDSAAEDENDQALKTTPTEIPDGDPGGTGTAAKGASGKMGSEVSTNTDGRYAVGGGAPVREISKARLLQEAAEFGAIGLLNGGGMYDGPIADWASDTASGPDPLTANGTMWGNTIDDAFGHGSLGLTGIGEGGDGLGHGIGLGNIGGLGNGAGSGCVGCQGFGGGFGDGFLARRSHKAVAPNPIRESVTKVSGALAARSHPARRSRQHGSLPCLLPGRASGEPEPPRPRRRQLHHRPKRNRLQRLR